MDEIRKSFHQTLDDIRQDMVQMAANDDDMKEMAREEIDSATAELTQLENELQRMLLPKDPDDTRNAFLEIRAGTGGDEPALFAGDSANAFAAAERPPAGPPGTAADPGILHVVLKLLLNRFRSLIREFRHGLQRFGNFQHV